MCADTMAALGLSDGPMFRHWVGARTAVSRFDQSELRQAWIRLRGTPDDPESWDFATWNGIAWEVRRELPNGRRITLQIRDYLVLERLEPTLDPRNLYRDREA
jgi:hypothetical protein